VGVGNRPQPPLTRITKEQYEAYEGKRVVNQGIRNCKDNSCPIK